MSRLPNIAGRNLDEIQACRRVEVIAEEECVSDVAPGFPATTGEIFLQDVQTTSGTFDPNVSLFIAPALDDAEILRVARGESAERSPNTSAAKVTKWSSISPAMNRPPKRLLWQSRRRGARP